MADHPPVPRGAWVNDLHSRLNRTLVREVVAAHRVEDVQAAVARARSQGGALSVCGGRHAMGGQQFGSGTVLLDTRGLARVRAFDLDRGIVEAEAGITWPELIGWLVRRQRQAARRGAPQWGIRQKQTGADQLSLGGALSANIHGRGLAMPPLVADVESFTMVDASGALLRCSRREGAELFAAAIGGYGLLGVITSVGLRLSPRRKLRRQVELSDVEALAERLEARGAEGCLYGDFQLAIDARSSDFLRRGVLSCYRPVAMETPLRGQAELSAQDWRRLARLAHQEPSRAFQEYAAYYLSTDGQVYWSDTHQLATYVADYHAALEVAGSATSSEMIGELYVPRAELAAFLQDAAVVLRVLRVPLVYGTVRLIERDEETALPWARQPWACVVLNLHTEHTSPGVALSAEAFRGLIDAAIARRGSYYLTYHRWARRHQVLACHPGLPAFLRLKRRYDPQERLQSDWYRHYRTLFADSRAA